jgi:hypothetical protein
MSRSILVFMLCTAAAAHASFADDSLAPQAPATQGATPQSLADARAACANDVQQLCSGVPTGGGRVIACLKQHQDKVSAGCKQAIIKATQGSQGGAGPATSAAPGPVEHEGASSAASAASSAAPQRESPPKTTRATGPGNRYFLLKQAQIIDQHAFASQVPAVYMMIPTDWKFDGKVAAGTGAGGCFADLAQVSFHAQSADGSVELEGIPGFSWQYADNPSTQREMIKDNQDMARFGKKPCPVLSPMSAVDFLRKGVLTKYRPGKTVVSVDPLPEFQQLIRARMGLPPQPGSTASAGGREPRIDAARARLQYDLDGKPVEEWVTAVTMIFVSGAGPGRPGPMGQSANNYDCHGSMMLALRAPQGRLDQQDRLFKLIASSIRVDPKWQAAVTQFIAQVTQADQQRKETNKRAWAEFQIHAAQVVNGVTANMMAGSEASVAAQSQLIRGVQNYRNPATGATFELSNQYNHAWLNGNNEYIMSDDSSFNPNSSLNGNWTPLQAVNP